LRQLRGWKRSHGTRQQTVSKRSRIFRSDARNGIAKIIHCEVTVVPVVATRLSTR